MALQERSISLGIYILLHKKCPSKLTMKAKCPPPFFISIPSCWIALSLVKCWLMHAIFLDKKWLYNNHFYGKYIHLHLTDDAFLLSIYSAGQKKRYKYCFMKQKFQLQMGVARYRNVTTLLSTRGINTTYHTFK